MLQEKCIQNFRCVRATEQTYDAVLSLAIPTPCHFCKQACPHRHEERMVLATKQELAEVRSCNVPAACTCDVMLRFPIDISHSSGLLDSSVSN